MDDRPCTRFFLEPEGAFHRQYEALRAHFLDDEPLADVAERFGYTVSTLKSMASRFRATCGAVSRPPFSRRRTRPPTRVEQRPRSRRLRNGGNRRPTRAEPRARPRTSHSRRGGLLVPAVVGQARLRPPRRRSRVSGLEDDTRGFRSALALDVETA